MLFVIFFYSQIVRAVVAHESALKAQAKKMNVDSLRSGQVSHFLFASKSFLQIDKFFKDANAESAEVRIAKVAVTNVLLWVCIWSPYAVVVMIAAFGDRSLVTPLVSQIPSFCAKFASVLNPMIFALSHPKFREALSVKCPCLCSGDRPNKQGAETAGTVAETSA